MSRKQLVVGCSAAALLLAATAAPARPRYHEVDLEAIVGGQTSAIAINNRGIVAVSTFTSDGGSFSFLVDSKKGQIVYRSPAGDRVNALSDNGNAAGDSREGGWVLFQGERRAIPVGHAFGVNDHGEVVGVVGGFFFRAAVYSSKDGTVTELGTLGGLQSVPFAINSSGQVTGQSDMAGPPGQESHAFRWNRGTMEDLGTLGASPSLGKAIDEDGRVVGSSGTPANVSHAFLAGERGPMRDLGTLPDCSTSVGAGINNEGDVVGSDFSCASPTPRAFLFSEGKLFDLNDLAVAADGFVFARAIGINDHGSIIGEARNPAGRGARSFLLVRDDD
jgi:probable HAF family extracellular repeat protein